MKLYRVANLLADGRKVYVSKRGLVHLMSEDEMALYMQLLANQRASVRNDPGVYLVNLSMYGPRSLFLETLSPFVMIDRAVTESADTPIDGRAFVLGGVPATAAGTFCKHRNPREQCP